MKRDREALRQKVIALRNEGVHVADICKCLHVSSDTVTKWHREYKTKIAAEGRRESSVQFSGRAYVRGYRWFGEL